LSIFSKIPDFLHSYYIRQLYCSDHDLDMDVGPLGSCSWTCIGVCKWSVGAQAKRVGS